VFVAIASVALARPVCHTPTMLGASAFAGTIYEAYRPAAVGFVDSAIYPLRVHYRREEDAGRAASLVLPALELSWAVLIDEMGWPAPPPDGLSGGSDALDVYLTNEGTGGGAYVWGGGPDVIAGDDWYTVPSHMAIDETLSDDDMLYYAAHELNHVSQYAMDAREVSTFIWESTAEAVAVMVDDGKPYIAWGGMPSFQVYPFLSLVFDAYQPEVIAYDSYSYYEYGGIIFTMFVEERYGSNDGTTLLALWDALAQPSASVEPDFLDALASIEPSGSLAALYTEFAVWRMFAGELDDGAHFEDGALWGASEQVGVEATLALADVDGFVDSPEDPPYDLGTSYYVLDLGAGTDETLLVDVVGKAGAHWGIAWAVWAADGSARTGTVFGDPGAPIQAEIPLAGGVRAQWGVVNAGPPDMSAVARQPRRGFELALTLLPPSGSGPTGTTTDPTGGTDPTDPAEDADPDARTEGCACSGSGSGGVPAALLLAPLWFARRRRGE
jgi:hypothetical protein